MWDLARAALESKSAIHGRSAHVNIANNSIAKSAARLRIGAVFVRRDAKRMQKMTTKKKPKFPDRVELGVGYPWAYGIEPYKAIGICKDRVGSDFEELVWPSELWLDSVPQYRLVLEKVEE